MARSKKGDSARVQFEQDSLGELLMASRSVARSLSAALLDSGLSAPQYLVLRAIGSESIPQSEIASRTGMDKSTVTDLVVRLHERGALTRFENEDDARSRMAALTSHGQTLLARARKEAAHVEQAVDRITKGAQAFPLVMKALVDYGA